MNAVRTIGRHIALVAAALALGCAGALAQNGPPNALQGFSKNRGQPINITADSLEVRDKEKVATFIGKVKAIQGDATIECAKLIVYYDGDQVSGGAPQQSTPGAMPANSQIRRLEAEGGVIVTQNEQVATGNRGVYDMKSETVTLTGSVVVAQGNSNAVSGDKLEVDLKTGLSRMSGGRVSGTFKPSEAPNDKPKEKEKPRAPAPPSATPRPGPPNNGATVRPGANGSTTAPRRDASQPMPLRQ